MSCMRKTEVYSWRLEARLKETLEGAARARNCSFGSLLARIAEEWLHRGDPSASDQQEQARIHAEAATCLGSVHGGDPRRAAEASSRVKHSLRNQHARRRTA